MTIKPEVFFGASDRQMEGFVDLASFQQSLVYGILFQGNLVIPDIFVFISGHMEELLLKDPLSRNFITQGFRSGAIIPIFRGDRRDSFKGNLANIRENRIQGVRPMAAQIAKILDDGVGDRHLHHIPWPKDPPSVGYRNTLEHCLFDPNISTKFPDLRALWEETADMRDAMLQGAKRDAYDGLRRGDLYNALNLFLNDDPTPVQDVRTIWTPLRDPHSVEMAQRILKWLNYCYSYNQGRMIDVKPGLSSLDDTDIQFVRHLAAIGDSEGAARVFSEEFRIPSAAAILTVDPTLIYDVRDSDIGSDYFSALSSWRLAPSDHTSHILLERLRAYTAAIHTVFLARGRSIFNWKWHLKAHIPSGKTRWGRLGRNALGAMASEALGELIPYIGLTSIVGRVAAVTYETLPTTWRDKIGPAMGIDTRAEIEVSEELTQFSIGTRSEASIQ